MSIAYQSFVQRHYLEMLRKQSKPNKISQTNYTRTVVQEAVQRNIAYQDHPFKESLVYTTIRGVLTVEELLSWIDLDYMQVITNPMVTFAKTLMIKPGNNKDNQQRLFSYVWGSIPDDEQRMEFIAQLTRQMPTGEHTGSRRYNERWNTLHGYYKQEKEIIYPLYQTYCKEKRVNRSNVYLIMWNNHYLEDDYWLEDEEIEH